MNSKHGYFVGAITNEEAHFAHLDKIRDNLAILTYLDNPAAAVKAAKRYLETAVIWRSNRRFKSDFGNTSSDNDGSLHEVYRNSEGKTDGSDKFLDERLRILDGLKWDGNVYIKLHNEAGWDRAALDWQHVTTRRAIERNLKVAPGGWSVGKPEFDQIIEAKPTLEIANANPDKVLYILNEYFAAVWMSGFTHDGVTADGDALYFTRFIPRDKWLRTMDGVTAFHSGRVHQWLKLCKRNGLRVRFGIGEHGPDAVGGEDPGGKLVDAWRKGLIPTDTRDLRFYLGYIEQWKAWWPEWSVGEALARQLLDGSYAVTYNHPDIVGACYFTEGQSSDDWEDANTERDADFKRVIENELGQPAEPPVPAPPPALAPFPADDDSRRIATTLTARGMGNLRAQPFIGSLVLRTFVMEDAYIIRYDQLKEKVYQHVDAANGGALYWVPVWMNSPDARLLRGWLRSDTVIEDVVHIPVVEPDTPDFATIFRTHRDMLRLLITEYEAERMALRDERHALDNRLSIVEGKIEQFNEFLQDYDLLEKAVMGTAIGG